MIYTYFKSGWFKWQTAVWSYASAYRALICLARCLHYCDCQTQYHCIYNWCMCVCVEEWFIRQCLASNTVSGADIEIQYSLRMSLKFIFLGVPSNSSVKVRDVSDEPAAFIFTDEEPGFLSFVMEITRSLKKSWYQNARLHMWGGRKLDTLVSSQIELHLRV